MLSEKRYQRFLLLARQFGLLLGKGHSQQQAFASIESALGSTSPHELKQLQGLISSDSTDQTQWIGGPARSLARIMSAVASAGADKLAAFKSFYQNLLRVDESQYQKNFDVSGLLVYLLMVMSILVLVSGIYAIFVLPGFESFYQNTGALLPGLTIFVLNVSRNFGIPLLIVFLVVAGLIIYVIYATKKNLRSLQFFTKAITLIPGINKVALGYNDYLALNFLLVLLQARLSDQQARQAVKKILTDDSAATTLGYLTQSKPGGLDDPLSFAAQLGNLIEEVEQQIILKREATIEEYIKLKSKISAATVTSVAVIVGTLVIAMYLPIFQIGKVVGG